MPITKALARSETRATSSRIWTRVTDTIFKDDNRYAIHVSLVINKWSVRQVYKPLCHNDVRKLNA